MMDVPTRRRLARTVHRLSSLRVAKYGKPPDDNGTWWQQIEALAAEQHLPITWDEWLEINALIAEHRRYREMTK
jgi:hypothetical protein